MKDYRSLFVLAVVFAVASVGVVWAMDNAKCLYIVAPANCKAMGTTGCKASGIDAVGGPCGFCDNTLALPHKVCVSVEGSTTCTPGSMAYDCGGTNVVYRLGICAIVAINNGVNVYDCVNAEATQYCSNPTYVPYCN